MRTDESCGFAAAYCEGLGLAAIAVIADADGARIVAFPSADESRALAAEAVLARWWCRRIAEAEIVAAAAARKLRRQSNNAACAGAAVSEAARRLGIVLQCDDEIGAEAMKVAVRIDAEMQKQQQSGGLKTVNRSYRTYRLETGARGERVLRYDEWMRKYKENLVRQVAAALR